MKTGDKVYVWTNDDNPIIGEVVEVICALDPHEDPDMCMIKSIIDDQIYMESLENVFHVGTGPVMDYQMNDVKSEDIFEDIPDDPDNVIMNIPPVVSASLGLDIGDTLVIESVGESLVLRKKEVDYKPDSFEGC